MGSQRLSLVALAVLLSSITAQAAPTAEVLHFWTSGGEARAALSLKHAFEARGGVWDDAPVAGGGGDAMAAVLRARVLAGVPPSVAQVKGQNIKEWAAVGALEGLNTVADEQNWDALLPDLLKETVQYQGEYVAVPLNIHRVDWIWANPKVLDKVGVTPPQTWDEFNKTAEKIKAAGFIPLAHGGQPWQDVTLFEVVLLGIGGADFYKQVYLDLDQEALHSDTMIKVFDQMRKLSTYVDPGAPGREWNLATAMVMRGEAAMQIMGDWAKAEFLTAGLKYGEDFICVSAPSSGGYIINSDSFAMFQVSDEEQQKGQLLMASMLLDEDVQKEFNLLKGSIPARLGVSLEGFDECAMKSSEDLVLNEARNTVVGSIAHELVQSGAVRGAFLDVVTEHFNTNMSSQEAVEKLAETVILAD
ncbi:carbohydrate ABC transporter substrate-binding protein, CUT1 family [Pseudovibrio denitrificans]|uniref:Probable sugar-binding periplasmic protein n=1 Tax=Pseudovibrio denitrificans TaxID=258256 RepID=A0A1I6YID4_9HYPH|nr:ABC transporter substrate-binding protein [Pseudovibrio denitrificans]SFT50289.1 carbohydrate ABC transporter substrate-binding protein, CUT1 family [Pseudovibrio denitrificans]